MMTAAIRQKLWLAVAHQAAAIPAKTAPATRRPRPARPG
jgi:hypothetical protein